MRTGFTCIFYISQMLSLSAIEYASYGGVLACIAILMGFTMYKFTRGKSLNNFRFKKELSNKIEKSPTKEISILVLEIENINEIHRYLGNEMEKEASRLIEKSASDYFSGYKLYSIFYNEIAIALSGINTSDAYKMADGFMKKYEKPIRINGKTIKFNMFCGIVNYPNHGRSSDEICKMMGRTLTRSKIDQRSISIYDSEIDMRLKNEYRILNCIYEAIEENELRIEYHPKIDISKNEVVGAEALLRWDNHNNINIAELIRVSENAGYITDISKIVISLVVKQMEHWKQNGIDINVSINISPLDLKNEDLLNHLSRCLSKSRIKPEKIELEITERNIYSDEEKAIDLLNRFHDLGCKIAMDDFGTGYNSLQNILDFSFDIVKIDKHFIDKVEEHKTRIIIDSIIKAAKKMGKSVVAEGVETDAQVNIIRQLGCTTIQGYYFSRPLDSEAFKDYYNSYGSREIKVVV